MESFHVKAARQSTGLIPEDKGPLSPVRNGAFDRVSPFKTNYNTLTATIALSLCILTDTVPFAAIVMPANSNRHARWAALTTVLSQIKSSDCLSRLGGALFERKR
jgi:hypothetical protein